MTYRELLLGCGRARDKRIETSAGEKRGWNNLTTLDHNPDVNADLVWDLNKLPWSDSKHPDWLDAAENIPLDEQRALKDSSYDEIHAYEVLEHLGRQGDARSFFAHFSEIYRLLKPNGYLCATVPSRHSPWAWGDPSHTRIISLESLTFLDQTQYIRQCDGPKKTPMSDFRNIYTADFRICAHEDDKETFSFVLQAMKPSRIGK